MANSKTTPNLKSAKKTHFKKSKKVLPPLPAILTKPLGLVGWSEHEAVLLAALVTGDPLILIGPTGSAKSLLLERLAESLEMEYRFYNASLINYDDLVGFPFPDEKRMTMKYIATPSAIWDAEIVFFDEINRTRPELQNKLFPIVHERRVQGINLDKLRYRWAAMNPPPSPDDSDEDTDIYFGAEPLDPALADRFSFIIEVPSWEHLTDGDRRSVIREQFTGKHLFAESPRQLIETAQDVLLKLQSCPPMKLEDYVLSVSSLLHSRKIRLSTRRAAVIHRNILAVHASRIALYQRSGIECNGETIDWSTSAFTALTHSLPQVLEGNKPDPVSILGIHRQSWQLCSLNQENVWKTILSVEDPVQRCIEALGNVDIVGTDRLSDLVLDAISAQSEIADRRAVALIFYKATQYVKPLKATVYETMANILADVLRPNSIEYDYAGDEVPTAKRICSTLLRKSTTETKERDLCLVNLLRSLIPDKFDEITPSALKKRFCTLWDQVESSLETEEGGVK